MAKRSITVELADLPQGSQQRVASLLWRAAELAAESDMELAAWLERLASAIDCDQPKRRAPRL